MTNVLMANNRVWADACAINLCRPASRTQRSIRVSGLNKSEAEDLLDWLQANGYHNYHVRYTVGNGFTVSDSNW